MGYLTVISETGFFHSAVLMQRGSGPDSDAKWFGFKPNVNKMPCWRGHVDHSDRTPYVNHYVTFQVEDSLLDDAEEMIIDKYDTGFYALGIKDCVSLSADAAWECGLSVAITNFTPYGLLVYLAVNNSRVSYDTKPFPWLA